MMSALSTFLIQIHDNIRIILRQTVLTRHYCKIVVSVNFLKSVKIIVREEFLKHDK